VKPETSAHRIALASALLAFLALASPSKAQEPAPGLSGVTLRVATKVVAPFVIKNQEALTGFSIDLWNLIAQVEGAHTQFIETDSLGALLDSVADKRADLALAAISITAEREAKFDFSQPIFASGLQILTRKDGTSGASGAGAIVKALVSPQVRGLLAVLLSVIFVLAHVVWFFDRRHEEKIKPYFPGIFRAAYWASGAAGGQQPFAPHSPIARGLGVICVFVSVIILAYFTAAVTSAMTIEELQGAINGPDDLPGKRVATVSNTTSMSYLRDAKVQPREYPSIDAAVEALMSGKVDALVYDSPALLYLASHDGKGKVGVVGPVFHHEAYGILYPPGSEIRRPIDAALLKLRENGAYSALYQKWFHVEE